MDSHSPSGLNTFERLAFFSTEIELEVSKLCIYQSFRNRTEEEFEVLKAQANNTMSPELEYVCLLFRHYVKCASNLRESCVRRSGREAGELGGVTRGSTSNIMVLSTNMPRCFISLHQQLNKSYPHVIHGLGALGTSLFWLRAAVAVTNIIAVILLSQTHLLKVNTITETIFKIPTSAYTILNVTAILVLAYSLLQCAYYLLPIDSAGYKTIPVPCIYVPARTTRTDTGMLVHTNGRSTSPGSLPPSASSRIQNCLRSLQHNAKTCELLGDLTLTILVFAAIVQGIAALRTVFSVSWNIPSLNSAIASQYTFETFLATFSDCLGGGSPLSPTHLHLVQGSVVMLAVVFTLEILIVRIAWKSYLDEELCRSVFRAENSVSSPEFGASSPMHNISRAHLVRSSSPCDSGTEDTADEESDSGGGDSRYERDCGPRVHQYGSPQQQPSLARDLGPTTAVEAGTTVHTSGLRALGERQDQIRQQLQIKQRGQWVPTGRGDRNDCDISDDSSVDSDTDHITATVAAHAGALGLAATAVDRLSLYSIYVSSPTCDGDGDGNGDKNQSDCQVVNKFTGTGIEGSKEEEGEEGQFLTSQTSRRCYASVPPPGAADSYLATLIEQDSMSV